MEKIGSISEFPEGRGTSVQVNGINIAVFNVEGKLYAIQNLCPHRRMPLHQAGHPRHPYSKFENVDRKQANGNDDNTIGEVDGEELCIRCPWHRMKFDLESGINPATDMQIATYDVQVEDGDVFIEL